MSDIHSVMPSQSKSSETTQVLYAHIQITNNGAIWLVSEEFYPVRRRERFASVPLSNTETETPFWGMVLDSSPVYAITAEMLNRSSVMTGVVHEAVPFLDRV